jgi:hypothetical protein
VLLLAACSADTNAAPREASEPEQATMNAQPSSAGARTGEASANDFGNSTAQPAAQAGGAAPVPREAGGASGAACTGGLYLGTYDCELDLFGLKSPLMGDVSFALEIDETEAANDCDAEFCPDLVIASGTGTLFGLAGFWGFEAVLEGGLDCTTGEFRASAPDGVWGGAGSSDPSDPDALWTVLDPPAGMFFGSLTGQHGQGPPERIDGDWHLSETASGIQCTGPFMVALQ